MNSITEEDAAFRERLSQLVGNDRPFEWAKAAGIPSSTWNRAWNEGTVPKARHLARIAAHARVTLDWLITGQGPMRRRGTTGKGDALDRLPPPSGMGQVYPYPPGGEDGNSAGILSDVPPPSFAGEAPPFGNEAPGAHAAQPGRIVSGSQIPPATIGSGSGGPLGGCPVTSEESAPSPSPLRIDEELLGSLIDGIHRAYSESRHDLSPRELGRIAARMLGDLGDLCETAEEQRLAIRAMLVQLRRTLREPPASSPAEDYLPRPDELDPPPEAEQDVDERDN